jgi:hypothetical protein
MKNIHIVLIAVALAGCASSSGVLRSGPDSFTVSTSASPGAGGAGAAKKSAYDQANQECARQSKVIFVVNERASAPSWTDGMHTVDLAFKCQ